VIFRSLSLGICRSSTIPSNKPEPQSSQSSSAHLLSPPNVIKHYITTLAETAALNNLRINQKQINSKVK
jgi:hypothetical protein